MIRAVTAIAMLWAISTAAVADYGAGMRAYQRKEYQTAFIELMPAARAGHIDAQYMIGVMYSDGEGVPIDMATAMEWFSKAARLGHAAAMYELAKGYLEGNGLPRDDKKGLKLLRRAARSGSAAAQMQLAVMYENGDRLPADLGKAFDWYRKAAASGSSEAQMVLARAHLEGGRLPADSVEAFMWAVRAAEAGDEKAHALAIGILDEHRDDLPAKIWNQAKALYRQGRYDLAATAWLYLAHRGVVEAQTSLAEAYASGHGVPRNGAEARRWREIAAGRGEDWKNEEWTPTAIGPYPMAEEHDDITLPVLIKSSKVEPVFPESHRIAHESGWVVLIAVIRKDGRVADISIARSSKADSDFERAAVEAVSQWRYEPATREGEPIDVTLRIFISFTIH